MIYSGKEDKESGVSVLHIYSDNHNLRKVQEYENIKNGSINYKMHFKSMACAEGLNTFKPRNLELTVFSAREPYDVFHRGRINIEYSPKLKYEYSSQQIDPLVSRSLIFFNKKIGAKLSLITATDNVAVQYNNLGQSFFFDDLQTSPVFTLIKLSNLVNEKDGLYIYDKDTKAYNQIDSSYYSVNDLCKSEIIIDTTKLTLAVDDVIYLDRYGYESVKVLEIKTSDNVYSYSSNNIKLLSADSTFEVITKLDNVNIVNLNFNTDNRIIYKFNPSNLIPFNNKVIELYVGARIELKSLNESEIQDNNLTSNIFDIIEEVQILPKYQSDRISLSRYIAGYRIHINIPIKNVVSNDDNFVYVNDDCTTEYYKFIKVDLDNITFDIEKVYSDRLEIMNKDNIEILKTTVMNIKEIN